MTKKAKLACMAAVFSLVAGSAGGALAWADAVVRAPFPATVNWSDTGETPLGAALVGRLTVSGRNTSIWSSHNWGLLTHEVAMFWSCSNGSSDGVLGTFTTSSLFTPKFSRNCPLGTTAGDAAGIIDDL